jgi:hypothetical protein
MPYLAGGAGGSLWRRYGMGKTNTRLEAVRKAYREALESARVKPTSETWARLLAAGKELSSLQEPKGRGRRSRRNAVPTIHDLEAPPKEEELEQIE